MNTLASLGTLQGLTGTSMGLNSLNALTNSVTGKPRPLRSRGPAPLVLTPGPWGEREESEGHFNQLVA